MKYIKIILLLIPVQLCSQNLVLNPSFEETKDCVKSIARLNDNINNWSCPTSGTTDFFNSCSKGKTGVPNNFQGVQNAKFGKKYIGIGMLRPSSNEYIQGKLSKKLTKP